MIINKITETVHLGEKYKSALGAITEQDIHEIFLPVFEKFPKLRAVAWRQWQIGSSGGRWIQTDHSLIFGDAIDSKFKEDQLHKMRVKDLENLSSYGPHTTEIERAISPISELLNRDICCSVFGVNAQVIISKRKISNCDYDDNE